MSVTRHHADWLSLTEVSGPFVSLPVLMRAFPHGLEPRDPSQAKALRTAYEDWQANPSGPGIQRAWVMHVLTMVLGYPAEQLAEGQALPAGLEAHMPEMGETLRPDFALSGPTGTATAGQSQLLIASYVSSQSLDKPVAGKHWKATPATRMMEMLHGTNVPLGLVTNGEQWMLVYAPRGETTGYASWYGSLWLDEPITLRSFHSLLGVRRFFGVAADSTLLALLQESANDQQEVTDQLGYQVREAVEVLVQSFDALDKDSNRQALKGLQPSTVYDAALTVMMRLVFLFSAEERGLLHLGKPLYDDNYAVSTLQEQLQDVADRHGEEVLERRPDAWARLLATFRAVHGGIQHQDLLMQAYGGSLFDPDRYPFLEGRATGTHWRSAPAEPLSVNNRVVLHLLNSLQLLRIKAGTGGAAETRRVSFRALGVEQIGHVYEGLLDHTAVRATEVMLGIRGTRKREPEIALAKLEELLAQGEDKLLDLLKEETDRSLSALRKELNGGGLIDEHRLRAACGQDDGLLARLRPFAGLIRNDSFDRAWVVLPGSIFVTEGSARRSTGTHYTPPSLTEPIVRHTLEPLVYFGPAEGLPKEEWKRKTPKEILGLKVCDMAMGSGAFLVQACRYLAERLVEAWENAEKAHPGQVLITPEGQFSEGSPSERLVPAEAAERIAIARRVVADRCLYGVDINPMAVEMAKLSMWLITVDANRPFTFLDHAFKCGDSLLGITSLEQLENFSLRPGGGKQQAFATLNLWRHIEEAMKKREMLEAMPSDTPEQIAAKAALYAEAEESIAKLSAAGDILVGLETRRLIGSAYESARQDAADHMMANWARGLAELRQFAADQLGQHLCTHWPLAFPEIISRGGFDAFIGNPPFMGGRMIGRAYTENYLKYLNIIRGNAIGSADLCAYFFLRAAALLSEMGYFGLIATKSIAEADSRTVCLDRLVVNGTIYEAESRYRWPGHASVVVAVIHFSKAKWHGSVHLNGKSVSSIDGGLDECFVEEKPFQLKSMKGRYGQGQCLMDNGGFQLTPEERAELIKVDPLSSDVIKPLYNGKDLNNLTKFVPYRWVINFQQMTEQEAQKYRVAFDRVERITKPYRSGLTGQIHESRFWLFWDYRRKLIEEISKHDEVLASSRHTKFVSFRRVPAYAVFTEATKLYLFFEHWEFAALQSTFHQEWASWRSATLGETTFAYSTTECLETWSMPNRGQNLNKAEEVGRVYSEVRERLMQDLNLGLTDFYNRFHNPDDQGAEIVAFRELQEQLDRAVAHAYEWKLDLSYEFRSTKNGVRYSITEELRREVLKLLIKLNHQRHAEEVAAAATQATATPAKRGRKKKDAGGQATMDF
jgi:hypothetical protein